MSTATLLAPAHRAFDLSEFVSSPRPITLSPREMPAQALTTGVLAVLHHLHHVEGRVLTQMRDVLVTPTHADPYVTAFLTTWAYERYWFGRTLRDILDTQAQPPSHRAGIVAGVTDRICERFRPAVAAVATNLLGRPVVAGILATSLADTLALRLSVIRLAQVCPALSALTEAVLHSTVRHLDFYREQVRLRLAREQRAQVTVRRALRRWRWPGTRHGDPRRARAVGRFLVRDSRAESLVSEADDALMALVAGLRRPVLRTELGRFVVHEPKGSNCAYSWRGVRR